MHTFQLCPYPLPAYKGRVTVIQRLLDKPVWTKYDVTRLQKIVDLTNESNHEFPDEWLEVVEKAGEMTDEWVKVDSLAPDGSLRRALTRPRKVERARALLEKVRKHQEWHVGHVKRKIGFKEYKTRAARLKQWGKLEKALANDVKKKRLDDLLKALYNVCRRY